MDVDGETMIPFPYKFKELSIEENNRIKKEFQGYLSGAVRVLPDNYFFQKLTSWTLYNMFNFAPEVDEIILMKYNRRCTTWTQEMVWLLQNNFNYEKAKKDIDDRFPFIEADSVIDYRVLVNDKIKEEDQAKPGDRLKLANTIEDPRCLKTHMPFSLLPTHLLDKCKVIYVARNPKDVVVSYFHHHRMWISHGFKGNFKEFFEYFINENVMWSPFWSHLHEAWERKDHPNMLLLKYDELKLNLPEVIQRTAKFLGKEISDEAQLSQLCVHLNIESMRGNPSVNQEEATKLGFLDPSEGGFIRKGKSGGWREYMDQEMQDKFNSWIDDNSQGLMEKMGWM
ncbi:unnamed protein product, partial [Meganyctiphanes norvegica]